jgi:epoxyqueuosine reductase QueG
MDESLAQAVRDFAGRRGSLVGFAPVDRFENAPEGHHPGDLCRRAATVIVLARPLPRGMLSSPRYPLYALHRAYHSVYPRLDNEGLDLALFLETEAGVPAVPVPSYAPMVYQSMEPWGLLSLKHAAVRAGFGVFGRNQIVHHPRYGSMLRFGAVVTAAPLPGDPVMDHDPCPPDCRACHRACAAKAWGEDERFDKTACMRKTIKHAIYPMALKDEAGLKNIERVVNTAGYNYWLDCDRCLKVCPNNRWPQDSSGENAADAPNR